MRDRGEGSIYKDSRGLWRASIELPPGPDGDRRRKVISSKSKTTLIQKMRALQQEKDQLGDLPTRSSTTGEWLTYWIENIAPTTRRPKTVSTYRGAVNNYLIPQLGSTKLTNLTPPRIRGMLDGIASDKSTSYASTVFNVLSIAMQDAVRDRVVTSNPVEHMQRPRVRTKPQEALTVDEAVRVLQVLATHPHGTMLATSILTGARRGEVLGLEVGRVTDRLDLSWQLQQIKPEHMEKAPADYERRHVEQNFWLVRPKTMGSKRVLPLVDPLKTLLERWIEAKQPTGLLFTRPNGLPIQPNDATRIWGEVLVEAEVERDVKLHGARHTTVDLLYYAGVPEDVISQVVGHSTRQMTRAYQTSGGQSQRVLDAMQSMSKLLEPK